MIHNINTIVITLKIAGSEENVLDSSLALDFLIRELYLSCLIVFIKMDFPFTCFKVIFT